MSITITTQQWDASTMRVFLGLYLIGEVVRPLSFSESEYFVYAIAPTGESFSLPRHSNEHKAIAEILVAAAEYSYGPHQIKLSHGYNVWTRTHRYTAWCPTCSRGGLPATPDFDNADEASARLLAAHHAVTGQPAEFAVDPQPLPESVPPVNSPYAMS